MLPADLKRLIVSAGRYDMTSENTRCNKFHRPSPEMPCPCLRFNYPGPGKRAQVAYQASALHLWDLLPYVCCSYFFAYTPSQASFYPLQVREWAAVLVPELANIGIDQVSMTRYPYPQDGHPIIGFSSTVPNVYIAVMHSGATLGPLVGQSAAAEITGTASAGELAVLKPYRLERDFSTSVQAYTVGAAQKV